MLRIGWEKMAGLVWVVVGLMVVGSSGLRAAEQPSPPPKAVPGTGMAAPPGGIYYLPSPYWNIFRPEIQKELELLPEQIEKLQQLAKRFWDQQQELYKGMDWAKMTPEERTAKWKELSDRMKQVQEEIRKEVEKILLPAQIDAIRDIQFRQYATGYLWAPQVAEKIGLTEEQKNQIHKLRQEYQEKQMQLMRELVEKQLDVLTPEQKQKLKEEIQKWMRF